MLLPCRSIFFCFYKEQTKKFTKGPWLLFPTRCKRLFSWSWASPWNGGQGIAKGQGKQLVTLLLRTEPVVPAGWASFPLLILADVRKLWPVWQCEWGSVVVVGTGGCRGEGWQLCAYQPQQLHISPQRWCFCCFPQGTVWENIFEKKKMLLEIATTYVLGKCDSRVTQ